jgi:hypothetical protein
MGGWMSIFIIYNNSKSKPYDFLYILYTNFQLLTQGNMLNTVQL